jgi:hypothetical protein
MATPETKPKSSKTTRKHRSSALAPGARGDAHKDSLAAIERFLPIAQREVAPESVQVFNGSIDLLLPNVQSGLAAITPLRDAIVERYPNTKWSHIEALPGLARAVILAATLAAAPPASAKEIAPKLQRLRALRPLMLQQLELLAHPEVALVDQSEVRAIREGTGPLDEARDAVAIATVFTRDREKLAGKHPFSAAKIAELREVGDWLLAQLLPAHAKSAPGSRAAEKNAYAAQRDLLWTLLVRWHDEMQRAATAVFSINEVSERVPSLFARTAKKGEPAAAAAATDSSL